jgi:hypothetical protein
MAYGTLKVDTITFTNGGADQNITVSGIVASTSGNLTATGTISGSVIQGGTLVSGATVTGAAGQFGTLTGNTAGFTTVTGTTVTGTTANFVTVSGTTVTGTTANFVTVSGTTVTGGVGSFTTLTGGITTMTSGVFALGTAALPSISFSSDPDTGIYSPGADQLAFSTNGTERVEFGTSEVVFNDGGANYDFRIEGDTNANLFFVDASTDRVGLGTSSPAGDLHLNKSSTSAFTTFYLSNSGANGRSYHIGVGGNTTTAGYANNLFIYDDITAKPRVVLDSLGFLGIGTNTPKRSLVLYDKTFTCFALQNPTTGNDAGDGFQVQLIGSTAYLLNYENAPTAFLTNGSERARIDSSGRLLVGTTTSSNFIGSGLNSLLQVQEDQLVLGLGIERPTNDASGPSINLRKTRSNTAGGVTVVQDGDKLAEFRFLGTDGAGSIQAAGIEAAVDGTPGANDMPGRLVFSTTADGAISPTERMRITSAGVLQIADAGDIAVGVTTGTKIGTATSQKIGFYNATPVVQPAAVADATDAATVITQLNDLLAKLRTLGLIAT